MGLVFTPRLTSQQTVTKKKQIFLGQEELKVCSIGHDAMMKHDAVHIGYVADVTAHLLEADGKRIQVTGLLQTGAVVSVMPINTWQRMGFTREDLIQTNLRLADWQTGKAIYVSGRTPIAVLYMGGQNLWMSLLVVENLDDSDQFILGRNFVRIFVMIDLNNVLIGFRNPDRMYVRKPVNRIVTDQNKITIFLEER